MRILIENYQYEVAVVKEILHGIVPLTNLEEKTAALVRVLRPK